MTRAEAYIFLKGLEHLRRRAVHQRRRLDRMVKLCIHFELTESASNFYHAACRAVRREWILEEKIRDVKTEFKLWDGF